MLCRLITENIFWVGRFLQALKFIKNAHTCLVYGFKYITGWCAFKSREQLNLKEITNHIFGLKLLPMSSFNFKFTPVTIHLWPAETLLFHFQCFPQLPEIERDVPSWITYLHESGHQACSCITTPLYVKARSDYQTSLCYHDVFAVHLQLQKNKMHTWEYTLKYVVLVLINRLNISHTTYIL